MKCVPQPKIAKNTKTPYFRNSRCDGQTDGQTPRWWLRRTKHYMVSRVKIAKILIFGLTILD